MKIELKLFIDDKPWCCAVSPLPHDPRMLLTLEQATKLYDGISDALRDELRVCIRRHLNAMDLFASEDLFKPFTPNKESAK